MKRPGGLSWRLQDLTGRRFGRLTVLGRGPNEPKHTRWWCRCDCGSERLVRTQNLTNGQTVSCGCYMRERVSEVTAARNTTHGKASRRNKSKAYTVWTNMIQRCANLKNTAWENYGGRGISVCERWRVFDNFYADVGDVPEGMQIDRIDNDGNYEPGNWRWADRSTQTRNRRRRAPGYAIRPKRTLTFNGETLGISAWARKIGVSRKALSERLRKGWSVEVTLTTPLDELQSRRSRRSP